MSSPSTSLLRLTRHASSTCSTSQSRIATRLFVTSSTHFAGRNDAAGSSSTVDLGARSTGFNAAKDEAGNPIGREPGPLYREWLASEGKAFKEPRPQETNYLGGSIVESVLHHLESCLFLAYVVLPRITSNITSLSLSLSILPSNPLHHYPTVFATSSSASG